MSFCSTFERLHVEKSQLIKARALHRKATMATTLRAVLDARGRCPECDRQHAHGVSLVWTGPCRLGQMLEDWSRT